MIYYLIRKSLGGSTVRALAASDGPSFPLRILAGELALNFARPRLPSSRCAPGGLSRPDAAGLHVSRRRDSPSTCRPVGAASGTGPGAGGMRTHEPGPSVRIGGSRGESARPAGDVGRDDLEAWAGWNGRRVADRGLGFYQESQTCRVDPLWKGRSRARGEARDASSMSSPRTEGTRAGGMASARAGVRGGPRNPRVARLPGPTARESCQGWIDEIRQPPGGAGDRGARTARRSPIEGRRAGVFAP